MLPVGAWCQSSTNVPALQCLQGELHRDVSADFILPFLMLALREWAEDTWSLIKPSQRHMVASWLLKEFIPAFSSSSGRKETHWKKKKQLCFKSIEPNGKVSVLYNWLKIGDLNPFLWCLRHHSSQCWASSRPSFLLAFLSALPIFHFSSRYK